MPAYAQGTAATAVPQPGQAPKQLQPEAAFALIAAEAEKGNARAMLTMGNFYERGVGIAKNYSKALEWYQRAAKAGQAEAYYNIGVCYEVGMGTASNSHTALQNFEKAADMGLAIAMYHLSNIYISGNGAPKNIAKALSYLEKAGNAGMANALNDLGVIYLSGLLEQKKDEKKALSFFTRAAELGNLDAIKNIALIYKNGLGVKPDPVLAYTWQIIAKLGGSNSEETARILGLIEGSLTPAQREKAQKDAQAWIKSYAERQQQTTP